MSHHKRGRSSTRAANKRNDAKRVRASARQALGGGRSSQPHSSHWHIRLPAAPIDDEAASTGPDRSYKGPRGTCRRSGRPHAPTIRSYGGTWPHSVTVCAACGKRLWGYAYPRQGLVAADSHMSLRNIQARLAGHPCDCPACRSDHFARANVTARLAGRACGCDACAP